ncbi:hypothetical protein, partial [Stackebrandtia soli]|uniref:hypothetical protein n=1 Tax=Stackebrandtia soli TaxID=1892856 RepID=UPI0039E88EB3
MPTDTPRPGSELLTIVTLWRLAIAAAAWYGLHNVIGAYGEYDWAGLSELSQLASLVIAVCYLGLACYPVFTGGRRHEPRSAWLRGALAVLMVLVCLTAILVLGNGGRLDHHGFFFEHLVTPALVTLDFILVGRSQRDVRWWYPLTWVSLPLAYFVFMLFVNPQEYGMLLSPQNPYFYLIVGGFLIAVLVIGYVLLAIARIPATRERPPPPPDTGFVVPQYVPRGRGDGPRQIGTSPAPGQFQPQGFNGFTSAGSPPEPPPAPG